MKRVANLIPKWLRQAGLPQEVIDRVELKLKPFVDLKGLDIEQTLASYKELGVPVVNILGATTFGEMKALMQLSLAMQNQATLQSTVIHEAWHIIKGWLMPKADIDAVGKHFKNEEEEAKAFAKFVLRHRNRLRNLPGPIRQIFMKIKRALQLISNGLRGRGFTRPEDFFAKAMLGQYYRPHYARGRTAVRNGTTISLAGEPKYAPWAFHQIIDAVAKAGEKMPKKVQALKNWVKKVAKPSELEWLDVDGIIDSIEKDGKVNPQDFLVELSRNQIHLGEIHRGSFPDLKANRDFADAERGLQCSYPRVNG